MPRKAPASRSTNALRWSTKWEITIHWLRGGVGSTAVWPGCSTGSSARAAARQRAHAAPAASQATRRIGLPLPGAILGGRVDACKAKRGPQATRGPPTILLPAAAADAARWGESDEAQGQDLGRSAPPRARGSRPPRRGG